MISESLGSLSFKFNRYQSLKRLMIFQLYGTVMSLRFL